MSNRLNALEYDARRLCPMFRLLSNMAGGCFCGPIAESWFASIRKTVQRSGEIASEVTLVVRPSASMGSFIVLASQGMLLLLLRALNSSCLDERRWERKATQLQRSQMEDSTFGPSSD